MIRVLDTVGDANAAMLGILMCKLQLTEVEMTMLDEEVLRGVLENGAIELICGIDAVSHAITLRLTDARDVPGEGEVIQ
jgi:hypothetical protein